MADYAIHEETLYDIADVIRKKDGSSALIDPADYAERINLMGMLEEKTVSGSVVTFSDGADAVKLKSCAVTIAPTLDGVSSVGVVHGVKNFVDDTLAGLEQGSISSGTGQNSSSNTRVRNADYIPFPLDKIQPEYVLTIPSGYKIAMRFYDKDKNFITPPAGAQGFINNIPSGYVGEGVEYARFILAKTDDSEITPEDMANVGFQIEVGSTATAYNPYIEPTTHTANLGRTIYGGSVDVVNGAGTENYKVIRLDSLPFIKNGTQNNPNGTYFSLDGVTIPFIGWGSGGRTSAMSNVLSVGSAGAGGQTEPNNTFWWNNASTGWRVVWGEPNGGSSLEDFMAFLTANNVVVGGTLSTPEDFTFTPVPIISRLGDNTMWGDGDLSVIYRSSGTQTIIQPTLISKTITENGTYSAEDDNADGYDGVTVNVQGGGGNTPQATQTLICDNSALGSSLTFTDDYENYDLIKFVVYRSDIGNQFTFYMTPAMINAMGQYSSNRINFNQPYGNNFVCYTKTSNTSWTRYGVRNLAVKYVYGLTFTNCTVTETELYNRQGIGSSNVTFTPPTGETFFDYDYILLATCTGNSDETQVNLEVFQPDIEKDIFGSDNSDENSLRVYKYNQGGTFVTVTENTITAFSYFYACGLKLSYNQQNLLGGSLNSSNSEELNELNEELNSEEEENENESD